MSYPEVLLPNLLCKKIECDLSGYLLIRQTPTKDMLSSSTLTLRDEAITFEEIHLIDYSTNLLGHYNIDHLKFKIIGERKKEFTSYWDYQSDVNFPVLDEDYIEDLDYGFFLLPIERFNGTEFPFKKGDNNDYSAKLLVVHKPTNCNFWHFEIRWHIIDEDGIPSEFRTNAKAKWQLSLAGTLKSMIKIYFEQEIPNEPKVLPRSNYIN